MDTYLLISMAMIVFGSFFQTPILSRIRIGTSTKDRRCLDLTNCVVVFEKCVRVGGVTCT